MAVNGLGHLLILIQFQLLFKEFWDWTGPIGIKNPASNMFAHTTQWYESSFYNQHLVEIEEHSVTYVEVMALRVQR